MATTNLDDGRRLDELRALEILDSAPEAEFDDLATLASALLGSPVAAVNFVDDTRHFTKAVVGLPDALGGSVPNDVSFCAATVQQDDGVLVVRDTHADERWRRHPLVTGGPEVGSYAGVAISSRGERVGVVCGFGREASDLSEERIAALRALARQAERQLDLRRRNIELARLAVSDPLTGLANRTLLVDHLRHALADRAPVGVLFCDIDEFKRVNDQHGHDVGDRVLCDVARHLNESVREGDVVARLAGDEFVVVLRGCGEQCLERVAERVASFTAPKISVGAVLALPGEHADDVLRRADEAMYLAKGRR